MKLDMIWLILYTNMLKLFKNTIQKKSKEELENK